MPTVKLKVNELVGTEVKEVSLVDRGANETPFKILKSADESDRAKITSILIRKGADEAYKAIKPIAEKLGVIGTEQGEHSVTLKFSEEAGVSAMSIHKDVIVCFDRMEKGLNTYISTDDFDVQVKMIGFYGSLIDAGTAVREVIYKVIDTADTQDETIEKIRKNIDAYKKYVVKLIRSMPAELWELDMALYDM